MINQDDIFIHPTALVETNEIGAATRIWAFTHLMEGASIGMNCNIGSHCFVESGAAIGANVTIKNGNMIWAGVTLDDGVFVGPQVVFTNDINPRSPRLPQVQQRYSTDDWLVATLVERGATLGAGSVIRAGCTIGQYAMVGAGAVITKDVLPYSLVWGVPGRPHGWVCECGQRLHFEGERATCGSCGRQYTLTKDRVSRADGPDVDQ